MKTKNKQLAAAATTIAAAPSTPRISLFLIDPDPNQPRKFMDDAKLSEMSQSVAKHGVIQSISVRPHPQKPERFMIIFGERRYRASIMAMEVNPEITDIPATVITNLTDEEVFTLQITENLQREDVSPADEAISFNDLRIRFNRTDEDIAAMVGKSKHYVRQRIALANLNQDWLQVLFNHQVKLSDALRIAKLDPDSQAALYEAEKDNLEPGEELELGQSDFRKFEGKLANAQFNLEDATLLPEAGACTNCRFNSTYQCLFPDETPICGKVSCFFKKNDLAFAVNIQRAVDDGVELVTDYYSSYENKKFVDEITKTHGVQVILANNYDVLEVPDREDFFYCSDGKVPDRSKFDDDDEYEEALRDYNSELKEYNEAVQEYEANIPRAKKVLCVDGNRKGEWMYVIEEEKKKRTAPKQSALDDLQAQLKALPEKFAAIRREQIQNHFNTRQSEYLSEYGITDPEVPEFKILIHLLHYLLPDSLSELFDKRYFEMTDQWAINEDDKPAPTESMLNWLLRAFMFNQLQSSSSDLKSNLPDSRKIDQLTKIATFMFPDGIKHLESSLRVQWQAEAEALEEKIKNFKKPSPPRSKKKKSDADINAEKAGC